MRASDHGRWLGILLVRYAIFIETHSLFCIVRILFAIRTFGNTVLILGRLLLNMSHFKICLELLILLWFSELDWLITAVVANIFDITKWIIFAIRTSSTDHIIATQTSIRFYIILLFFAVRTLIINPCRCLLRQSTLCSLICLVDNLSLIIRLLRSNRLILLKFWVISYVISRLYFKVRLLLVLNRLSSLFFQVFFFLHF